MKLLYFREHLSCMNYPPPGNRGFVRYKLAKGDVCSLDNALTFCILFLLEGKVSVTYGAECNTVLGKNKMLIIPQRVENKITTLQLTHCLVLFWDGDIDFCNEMYIQALNNTDAKMKPCFPLTVRQPILKVLLSISYYLKARLQCKHMNQLKQNEFLLVLRGFYSKKELAGFFAPVSYKDTNFESFVLKNYTNVKTTKEFADLYHCSERTFARKFHICFSESPYKWLKKKKAEQILEQICKSDKSFSEIAFDYQFSSPSHFTTYCKQIFGQTPTKIRRGG